jgi:hypothetical protein
VVAAVVAQVQERPLVKMEVLEVVVLAERDLLGVELELLVKAVTGEQGLELRRQTMALVVVVAAHLPLGTMPQPQMVAMAAQEQHQALLVQA